MAVSSMAASVGAASLVAVTYEATAEEGSIDGSDSDEELPLLVSDSDDGDERPPPLVSEGSDDDSKSERDDADSESDGEEEHRVWIDVTEEWRGGGEVRGSKGKRDEYEEARVSVEEAWAEKGGTIERVAEDGNCLFSAIAAAAEWAGAAEVPRCGAEVKAAVRRLLRRMAEDAELDEVLRQDARCEEARLGAGR